jgi:hypothetical protein
LSRYQAPRRQVSHWQIDGLESTTHSNPIFEGVTAVRNFLENRLGKEIEVCCQGITVSGKVSKVEGNVLYLEKDGVTAHVNIEKIIIVWDSQEKKAHSPGFISQTK